MTFQISSTVRCCSHGGITEAHGKLSRGRPIPPFATRQNTNDQAAAGGSITSLTPETQEFTMLNLNALVFIYKGLGVSLRYNQVVEGKRALFLSTVFGGVFASF